MLTENEARDLLTRAANTIDVAHAAPIDETARRRRTLPLLAAAAAVVGLVSTAALLGPRLGDQATPGGPVAHPPAAGTLADDQVPTVFGYDAESAKGLLEAAGLNVTIHPQFGCDDIGRAKSTEPATGTRFAPGDQVTLLVGAAAPNVRCLPSARMDAWDFIDFANGRGGVPAFAKTVSLYVDGELTATLTADQAADAANWGDPSAITEIRRESAEVDPLDASTTESDGSVTSETRYLTPYLAADYCGSKTSSCFVQAPAAYADRLALSFGIFIAGDGPGLRPLEVALYTTDGAIDTVVTSTEQTLVQAGKIEVPDVVGMAPDDATATLESAGLTVKVVQAPDSNVCHGQVHVLDQRPAAGSRTPAGATVTVTTGWKLCGVLGNAP